MQSSISIVAAFRSYGLISTGRPFASRMILHSGKSKSTAPLAMRFSLKTRAVSSRSRNIGTKSSYSSRHFFANSAFSFAASFFFSRSSACTFFRLRFDFFCSSFSKRSSWFRPFVSSNSASSPLFFPFFASRIAFTAVYVILRSMFTTDSQILCPTIIPFSSISIRQLIASLSHPAFREQIPLESLWGSIGITRSTRYTLVPRLYASSSRGLFSFT